MEERKHETAADEQRIFQDLVSESVLGTHRMYLSNYSKPFPIDSTSSSVYLSTKISDEYKQVKNLAPPRAKIQKPAPEAPEITEETQVLTETSESSIEKLIGDLPSRANGDDKSTALVEYKEGGLQGGAMVPVVDKYTEVRRQLILKHRQNQAVKPEWHAPWKLMRVIAGHLGWVRGLAVEPGNDWFASGAQDRTIKIWDLASGTLKLTLTGHVGGVRGLAVSARHPYLFSVGDDKLVKCWDLEQNKVVRAYFGHLSGVYCLDIHPTLDLIVTGGRDSSARVWDIRTKANIRVLGGHSNAIAAVACQSVDPQVITGSHDSTIRCWDLASGTCMSNLTNHKKSVRALKIHHSEYSFASGSTDNIKIWKCPENSFMRNMSGHNTIVNTLALNRDNVLVSGGDNGSLYCWDWKTGYNFQKIETPVQPGSLEGEAGILASIFDQTGSRLITGERDKSIKIYKEDETATEETHPLDWKPQKKRKRY